MFGVSVSTSLQDLQAFLLQYYDGEAMGLKISLVRNLDEHANICDAVRAGLGGGEDGLVVCRDHICCE